MQFAKNKKIFSFTRRSVYVLALAGLLTIWSAPRAQAAAPRCFNPTGDSSRACDTGVGQLEQDKCYVEVRSGPNGDLTGYNETSCGDPTDRIPTGNTDDDNESADAEGGGPINLGGTELVLCNSDVSVKSGPYKGACPADQCGKDHEGDNVVFSRFNFGCVGEAYPEENLNPILDLFFAVLRVASYGVGFLLVLAIVISGLRYTAAQGDPQAIAKAIGGVRNAVIGLLVYFLAFALLQWLTPGGVFNGTAASGSPSSSSSSTSNGSSSSSSGSRTSGSTSDDTGCRSGASRC